MKSISRMLVTLSLLITTSAFAQRTLGDGVKELATQISTSVSKEQKKKVAVLPFRELEGQPTVLGTYLAEELVTNLFQIGNFEIVERQLLDKLMGELKIQQSGAVDPSTAKEIGRVAGVDAIVTGSITDLQSYVGINCRLIDTTTGKIFGAAQTKITKDDDVKKIMAAPLARQSQATGAVSKRASNTSAPQATGSDFKVVIDSAERRDDAITLSIAFVSIRDQNTLVPYGTVYLLDEDGERWDGRFEDLEYYSSSFSLVAHTRVRRRVTFRPVHPGSAGTSFTLVNETWKMTIPNVVPTTR